MREGLDVAGMQRDAVEWQRAREGEKRRKHILGNLPGERRRKKRLYVRIIDAQDVLGCCCATENSIEVKMIAICAQLEAAMTYALNYTCRVTFLVGALPIKHWQATLTMGEEDLVEREQTAVGSV